MKITMFLKRLFRKNSIFYVGATDILPPPLEKEEEDRLIDLSFNGDINARNKLIEHNLRLVVFLAKRYENTKVDLEDLVSIGSIGLIKGINTFSKDKNIKLATYTSYETYIRGHLKPYFSNIKLQSVSAEMLQKFFNYKQNNGRLDNREGGLSAKTLKNMYNMLHASFKQAYINGLVQTNIVETIRTPKIFRKEMRVLTREEQNKLIHVARNYRLGIVVILDLFTGMRLGEILALKWCDVDLKGQNLIVRNSIKRLSTHEKASKNQNKTKLILDSPKSHADKVQVTFHTLRHTFATRAIEQGMEIPVLSKILGHADISTTLNKYCHAIPDRKRENMEKIECLYDNSLDSEI